MTDLALTRPHLTRRRLMQIGALAPLAGCSLPGSGGPPRKFSLRPQAPIEASGPSWALGIDAPKALKGLDSERIAYRAGAFELQYYADADWIDLAPEMVQMVLVRSFQNRTRLAVSGRGVGGAPPDFLLTSLLQDFQADGGRGAQVTLVATLSPANRRRVVRTKTFEANARSTDDRIDSVVAAFDEALARITNDLIAWTLAAAEEEKREA
ncbi:MAG TPA: ABC-type transport auxiliary lipoprotein family protein [Magnetospirillaceae bacterium]|nr:ABC-type transport auxiliary lipoprotein family protein [Magnetospirillaceae bacterium]